MPGVLLWGYDATNKVWVPLQVDANGLVKVDLSNVNLNDLGDVSVAAPADDDLFYYDDATGLWKSRKLVDADIPAAIARDAEVAAAVAAEETARIADVDAEEAARIGADSAHAALTTGTHGLGALHAAGFHSAGEAVSKVIWKDVSERALSDIDRTATLDWTDLDLTAYTSANAKLGILKLGIKLDAYTSGYIYLGTRKNGTTPAHWPLYFATNEACSNKYATAIIAQGLDIAQVIEYTIVLSGTAQVDCYIDVLGYIE